MSFKKYSELYLKFKENELKNSTFYKYSNIITSRFDVFMDKDIDKIKPSDIKLWLYDIDDVSNKSKRHYLGVLSGIFQEAFFDEVINYNPVKRLRLPKVHTAILKPFTSDDVNNILSYMSSFTTLYHFKSNILKHIW